MGATLAGETPPEQGGASEAGVPPTPQQREFKSAFGTATSEPKEAQEEAPKAAPQASPEAEAEPGPPPPPKPEHGEPQLVSNDSPKLVKRRSRSGHVVSVLEDIQRLPTDAIYQEFNRLLSQAQGQIKEVADMPCQDMADRLKNCLHHNRQQSCECFPVMEQYRQCVLRATQIRVDDMADSEPMLIPVVPPTSMPRPANPPQCKQQHQRSWWRFWTWFK